MSHLAAFIGISAVVICAPGPDTALIVPLSRRSRGTGYRQGLLNNLGNPKIAVFFTSLLPQFGSGFLQPAALGLLFCATGALWLTGYTLVVARARGFVFRPRVRRVVDTLTGITLVAFGARLAVEQR